MGNNRPPLKEIAKALEVSPATVSLVLHNRPGVSDETRQRITEQLKEYGYFELKSEPRMGNIHLFKYSALGYHTGKNDSYTNAIVDAIVQEAGEEGYNITISSCREGEFKKTLEMMIADPLDGMILLGTDLPLVYEAYLDKYEKPVVLVDTYMHGCKRDSIVINNQQCMHMALKHLKDKGHKKIGFVYSCFKTFNYTDRYASFVMEMERLQIPVNSDYFFPANPLMEGTYDNIVSILEMSGNFPTAIVTDNDTSAVGMLNAFKRKYEVPEKISIVGMGDTFYCRLSSPSITVVQIHAYDIDRKAVKMLHERANNLSAPICKVSIGGELVPRNSVKTLW